MKNFARVEARFVRVETVIQHAARVRGFKRFAHSAVPTLGGFEALRLGGDEAWNGEERQRETYPKISIFEAWAGILR